MITATPTIRVVESADELMSLREEWHDLLSRCPGHHFSQTFDWAVAGWKHVGEPRGRALHVLAIRAGNQLRGVWPLCSYQENLNLN